MKENEPCYGLTHFPRFARDLDGTAELEPGGKTIKVGSKAPGDLWHKAIEDWKGWTD
jgi:hypothetical protein